MAKAKAAAKPADPLEEFEARAIETNGAEAIMLMFWKDRHRNPTFTIEVTPEDLKGFRDCIEYLEVTPKINIFRPKGVPARDAIPAQGKGRAIPGHAAIPPKNYVVVQMVDQDDNAFVPVENNEDDLKQSQQAAKARSVKEGAKGLAAQLQADLRSGTFSTATIEEAIAALNLLGA